MSYTAPTYVDTKAQAILALASTIADEDKTLLGDGSVNKALDVLADVLAEQDVQVPQTDAGAILALAQYVTGGGGGGGEPHSIKCFNIDHDTPVEVEGFVYPGYFDDVETESWVADTGAPKVESATAGTVLAATEALYCIIGLADNRGIFYPFLTQDSGSFFTMPDTDIELYVITAS